MSPRWLLPVLLLATTAPWAPAGQPWADRDPAREIRAHDRELAGRNPEGYREKCRRMSQDAFAFFRGTSYLFYKDLAAGAARELDPFVPTAARAVWLQGDCHAENFGVFQTGSGKVVYDIQDFDEALPGPYHWDLLRLAASFVLAREERADGGAGKVLDALCDSYTRTLLDPAAAAKVVYNSQEGPKFLRKTIEKAEEGGRPALLAKLTETRGGKPVFKRGDRLFDVPPGTAKAVAAAVEAYGKTAKPSAPSSQLAVKDVVGKLTKGIASVGMDRYLVLAEGPTARPADDLVLEVKEEAESTLGRGVGAEASPFSNEGERYVAGARAVQGDPDRWLGWTRVGDRDFVVREQSPYKTTVELTDLEDGDQWQKFAEVLGALAARSVSRGKGAAAARKALGGKEQEFAHAVKRFAKDYAEQAKEDYTVFKRSLDK